MPHLLIVSAITAIEDQIRSLPLEEVEQLQDWLAEFLEDQLELSPAFAASIERGRADLRESRSRRVDLK